MNDNGDRPLHIRAAEERDRRGWTQKDAANAAGMSLRAYQSFENGKTKKLQAKSLRGIIRAFDLDASRTNGVEAPHAPTAGELCPTCHRPVFPTMVEAFRNVVGAHMLTMSEDEREAWMFAETRRIFEAARKDRDPT